MDEKRNDFANLFVEATKIAGKESSELHTTERNQQEAIAKKVKELFENFTDAIVRNIDGWDQGKGSKKANIRPKGSNSKPFSKSIWNFYKPKNIKNQDISLLLIGIVMDAEKNEIFSSVGIHDRRNDKKYRQNVLDTNSVEIIYQYITKQIKLIDFDKQAFRLENEREFVYQKSLNNFEEVVSDFQKLLQVLINIYNNATEQFPFLENDIEIKIDKSSEDAKKDKNKILNYIEQPLNQILYGPPGTGKTYHTINKAIEIIDNDFFQAHKEETPKNRKALKVKFEEYRKSGQIEFVTFHQSYGYEEFVEGIKAETTERENIKYEVKSGIFKQICEKAQLKKGLKLDLESLDFLNFIKPGQKFKTLTGIEFEIISVNERVKVKNSQNTEHSLSRNSILSYLSKQDFKSTRGHFSYQPVIAKYIFDKLNKEQFEDNTSKNYILIIDEINRGNISKIFGELITLIEESKRIGKEEEIRVKLPYSGDSEEPFGVPSNLYIIGTMNTADRSIALMDTALRRRFDFEEMMPNLETLNEFQELKLKNNDGKEITINIKSLLETINKRIEYLYDRDHTIGHAYFMELKDGNKQNLETLSNIFKNKIIPLLQEYFYDDWEKIRLVLGDNQKTGENEQYQFIKIKKDYDVKGLFGNTSHELVDDEETKIYEINDDAFGKIESYIKIYE
ncbi:MAG: AAA family ATPase [Campylobacterales bacterium]|nr:AAA family ATPase [Campylobacterales bacterium]